MTGVCVNETKTCEVLAWCPVEDDHNIPEYVETLKYSYCKLTLTCDDWICDDSVIQLHNCLYMRKVICDDLCASTYSSVFCLFPSSPPTLMSAENYTLFIKNSVTFPLFRVSRWWTFIHIKFSLAQQMLQSSVQALFHILLRNPVSAYKWHVDVSEPKLHVIEMFHISLILFIEP